MCQIKIYKETCSCIATNITVKHQCVPEIQTSAQESKYFGHLCLILLLPQQDCFSYDLCNTQYWIKSWKYIFYYKMTFCG